VIGGAMATLRTGRDEECDWVARQGAMVSKGEGSNGG